MKPEYREKGFPDYDLFTRLTRSRFADAARSGGPDGGWQLLELDGSLPHAEVGELMAEAAFLVNLNSHEGWNATVIEAMAAGCLPICYDAFGGLDFLVDGENAFVFPNHHVFPLVEKTLALIDGVEAAAGAAGATAPGDPLLAMRLRAREHAARFDVSATRDALGRVFPRLLAAARR